MSLLRAFGLGLIVVCGRVFLAEHARDLLLALAYGLRREVHRVGTHVGYESLLVKVLRHRHGLRHRHAQLAARLLLKRRGGERSGGIAFGGLLLGLGDGEDRPDATAQERLGLVARVEAVRQLGLKDGLVLVVRGVELRHHAEIGRGAECYDLALALDDQTHGHALHATRRERRFHLFPQHGRELEADDAVQHAARLLGVHQIHVDGARGLYRAEYGGFGDLVEHDSLGLVDGQIEHLGEVPRYGLSLAVLIGRQPHGADALG